MYLDYMKFFDFLFPPSDDELRVKHLPIDVFDNISVYDKKKTADNGICSLLPYSDGRVKSAIHLLKFYNHKHARALLARVLTMYLHEFTHKEYIIIPIPLSSKRLQKRGYNQVTEVLQTSLHKDSAGTLATNILVRVRDTTPQTKLRRSDRLKNIKKAFAVNNANILRNTHVLLVDDVTTTGTTLTEAKATLLLHSPASVTCVALAH